MPARRARRRPRAAHRRTADRQAAAARRGPVRHQRAGPAAVATRLAAHGGAGRPRGALAEPNAGTSHTGTTNTKGATMSDAHAIGLDAFKVNSLTHLDQASAVEGE